MPRYDESPRGHSPLDRRDRRLKSPLAMDRRRRDSPPLPPPSRLTSRDPLLPPYHHEDYVRPAAHHSRSSEQLAPTTYRILCVSNISNKYPDSTVRNELIKEFSRFGNPSIKLVYDKNTRLAYLYFTSYEDARDARHSKSRLILFDKPIMIDPIYDRVAAPRKRSLTPDYGRGSMRNMSPPLLQRRLPPPPPPHRTSLNHDRYPLSHSSRDMYRDSYGHQMNNRNNDSFHSSSMNVRNQHHQQQNQQQQQREAKKEKFPNYLHHIPPEEDDKSTRTLFVGNLEVTITEPDLRRIFERYGVVEDVDVKRPPPGQGNAYAFIKFLNLDMAHRAKVEMSGQYIGKFQCKIGYGKATPTTRIWVGGLGPWISLGQLDKEFDRFGVIRKIDYVKGENHAYIQYDTIDAAQAACAAMRGYPLGGSDKRLRIDYADPGALSTSPRPTNEPNSSFSFNNSPRSVSATNNNNNNNGTNFEYWSSNQDSNAPSPKRRRAQSTEGDERKKSPNNLSSFGSPRGGVGGLSDASALEMSNGKTTDMKLNINENVTSITELIRCCPPTWTGGLILKTSAFALRMGFVSGDIQLVDLMKDPKQEQQQQQQSILKITQRLRLESSKLEDVSKRISSPNKSGHCILIASQANLQLNFGNSGNSNNNNNNDSSNNNNNNNNSSASGGGGDGGGEENMNNVQQRPIRNLVTYLKSKDAAGVVILPGKLSNTATSANNNDHPQQQQQQNVETTKNQNVLYLFPPHSYSLELIQRIAPNISADSATKEDYFVVVIVRNNHN